MTDQQREELNLKIFGWNGEEFNREALNEAVAEMKEEWESGYLDKAMELYAAGWKSECPSKTQNQIMSWYWRRPGPRGGRLFLSTDQALTAMRKAKVIEIEEMK